MAATFTAIDAKAMFGNDPAAIRARVEVAEKLLERVFIIPGINRAIGFDAIVGLIPVAGDLIAGAMGLYIVFEARNLGMPKRTLVRMLANIGIDTAFGAVPIVGDLFDMMFRSNSMNLKLIRKHLDRHHPSAAVINAR